MAEFVRDVMTPGVVAVRPAASLVEAAQLMRDHEIGAVVVADGQDVVGVLTDRDIAVRAVAEGLDPQAASAGAVCTSDPLVVGPYDRVSAAVALMRAHAVRRLPVVEAGMPVGVVSLGDLAEAQSPRSALADISRAAADSGARTTA
ncbi:oxidoreductase [Streptomyces sp. F-3]|jgi:CBS domain-containing protein|uniref:CBS domain-containing protein n=1 Tax=Streptomyces thermogriseus TaxID=75292 RepID=A0ABN1SZS0_9ACTN|nr:MULTISPECIES: CBS domain-containing protein [Streptomyces]MDN5380919.1 CBS domain-containing protein [Streptomyces sp. LB8]GAT79893.1 oxidoreductase [Streptomyces sp. F-3]